MPQLNSNWISASALVTALLAIIGGSVAYGQQSEKLEQLVQDRAEDRVEQKALRNELNVLNTQTQIQQVQFDALIKQLETLNQQLKDAR